MRIVDGLKNQGFKCIRYWIDIDGNKQGMEEMGSSNGNRTDYNGPAIASTDFLNSLIMYNSMLFVLKKE